MDSFLWRPVLEGMWTQKETFDGTYDFADLCEVNEVLKWRAETIKKNAENG